MSPELYYAVMLITNPQKAKRILAAEELENFFMDLFDEELEDLQDGVFLQNQEEYIDRIIDKYLDITRVDITSADEYSQSVLNKAVRTATQIQETTVKNILLPQKTSDGENIGNLIGAGIAIGGIALVSDKIKRWFDEERANLIALNEANWIFNNEEYFDARDSGKRKTWHTSLDEKVRFSHMEVEGVTLPVDEPFHVGMSLMQYPLDMSLGASAEEIVNCRCSVSYE